MIDILHEGYTNAQVVNGGTDTGGTLRTLNRALAGSGSNLDALSGAANNTFGIQVGTGVTAVAIGDTALVTLIADGVAATQLQYGATSAIAPSTAGSTRSFTVSRTLTNNSGGTVTIQEVGLVLSYTADALRRFLVERSLSTQAILNTASATATYTIGVTV